MDYHECMKEYYERRAVEYDDAYLGIGAYSGRERPGFAEELAQVMVLIEGLPPTRVLDIGCGTGFMTRHLKGKVVGLDQSAAMLEIARGRVPEATFLRAGRRPQPALLRGRVRRAFVGNLLGVLPLPTRAVLVEEARRVASELIVFETSASLAEKAEQWQERALSDGSRYEIYRRYFTAGDLAEEPGGGRVLFDGDHFVVVASQKADPGRF
jgi:SAM-dependent methyltransferase